MDTRNQHEIIHNKITGRIIELVMDMKYKMKYYKFPEEMRAELIRKQGNFPLLVDTALWNIEHCIKKVIEENWYIQERFPDWKEAIDAAIKEINQLKIDYILNAFPIQEQHVADLRMENNHLKNNVHELERQLDELRVQVATLTKTIAADKVAAEAKKNEKSQKNHYSQLFSFANK